MSEQVIDSAQLEWNRKRGLELLGNSLYKDPFISGLIETIKNSKEENANSVEIILDGYNTTTIIEEGGNGILPDKFKDTVGTVFTQSKDNKHFGIGRLGILLVHEYTDFFTIYKNMIFHWRICSSGIITVFAPVPASPNDKFSVKIIGYSRKENGHTDQQIRVLLEQMIGCALHNKRINIKFNGENLQSPLGLNVKSNERIFAVKGIQYLIKYYWKECLGSQGFSIVCENEIGVRKNDMANIIVYFDQDCYLSTTMNREDFQQDAIFHTFKKNMKLIFMEIVPRENVSDETIKAIWKKIWSAFHKKLYDVVTTKKLSRKSGGHGTPSSGNEKTRYIIMDAGDEEPFLWFDKEQEVFIWNKSHTVTVGISHRWNQRQGRLDMTALPLARVYALLNAVQSSIDWEKFKEIHINADRDTGRGFKISTRQHESMEEEF